jgi:hypothetical protein
MTIQFSRFYPKALFLGCAYNRAMLQINHHINQGQSSSHLLFTGLMLFLCAWVLPTARVSNHAVKEPEKRDWNEEFQKLLEFPTNTPQEVCWPSPKEHSCHSCSEMADRALSRIIGVG